MRLLIVDDELLIRNVIKEYALDSGYEVAEAEDGLDALRKIEEQKFDLVILDVMMPNMDGFRTCTEIKKNHNIPVIILSARTDEIDKLLGFDLGIDDYLTKPFSPKELMARIKAILKRHQKSDEFIYETLKIDFLGHTVTIDNEIIRLTPKEYEILVFLVQNKNIAISRETLLEKVWGYSFFGDDRTIDTHIKKLRLNLGVYRDLIQTVRNMGYKFEIKS